MVDGDIDQLTRQLETVRIQQETAIRILEETNRSERDLIKRIRAARRTNPQRRHDPHRVGDFVHITNTLQNKHGITRRVISSPPRPVTIRNQNSNQEYKRAWWNLELVYRPTELQNDRRVEYNHIINAQ